MCRMSPVFQNMEYSKGKTKDNSDQRAKEKTRQRSKRWTEI